MPQLTDPPRAPKIRLTDPQIELLTDIATHPQMYVNTFGRWGKTAYVLARHRLAKVQEVDNRKSEVTITAAGRAEAIRRKLVPVQE